jgi:hypothetical protein
MAVSEDEWTVLRALKTGDPPHSERALVLATGLEELVVIRALEALARTEPPLAGGEVDVRIGERLWAATRAGDDALAGADPRIERRPGPQLPP